MPEPPTCRFVIGDTQAEFTGGTYWTTDTEGNRRCVRSPYGRSSPCYPLLGKYLLAGAGATIGSVYVVKLKIKVVKRRARELSPEQVPDSAHRFLGFESLSPPVFFRSILGAWWWAAFAVHGATQAWHPLRAPASRRSQCSIKQPPLKTWVSHDHIAVRRPAIRAYERHGGY